MGTPHTRDLICEKGAFVDVTKLSQTPGGPRVSSRVQKQHQGEETFVRCWVCPDFPSFFDPPLFSASGREVRDTTGPL